LTREDACRLVCGRCRDGQVAERFNGGDYFYHGNPLVKCDASALWAAEVW
jgi:hypothetical protein